MNVAAAVLAAGGSRRLGTPKQIVPVEGVPLVRRAAQAALDAGCSPVVVVVGGNAATTLTALVGIDVRVVLNPSWREGLASSLRCAIDDLARRPEGPPGALVVLGCDQPALTAAVLARLIAKRGPDAEDAAACTYSGVLGTPAAFGSAWYPRLADAVGDRGAAALLRAPGARVTAVPWPEGARDIDRPDDLPRE